MIFDEILIIIVTLWTDVIGFADDLKLGKAGRILNDLARQKQNTLDRVVQWAQNCGLKINNNKTVAIIFHTGKSNKFAHPPPLFINGNPIQYANQVKYLGVILTHNLNWTTHVTQKLRMAKSILHITKSAIGTVKGPAPLLMKWAYTGVVRPKISYGCYLWLQHTN